MSSLQDAKDEVILIDLDVLLDTRLASFAKLYPDRVNELLNAGYRDRRSDRWAELGLKGIDQVLYEKRFANRDKRVLKVSRMTDFMKILLKIVKQYEIEMTYAPDKVNDVIIVINTHPYDLDDSECAAIVNIVREYVGSIVKVRVTSMKHELMSVNYLKYKQITQFITYDFYRWMELHYSHEDESKIQSFPDLQVIAPALIYRGYSKETLQEIREHGLEQEDPFELLRLYMSSNFGLTFLPPANFSYLDPAKLEK